MKNDKPAPMPEFLTRRVQEGVFILLLAASIFLLTALMTYNTEDPGWSHATGVLQVQNAGGRVGAWFADIFLTVFGYFAYCFPVLLMVTAGGLLRDPKAVYEDRRVLIMRITGVTLVVFAGCALASIKLYWLHWELPYTAGGILGHSLAQSLASAFNPSGTSLLLWALALTGVTLATGISWLKVLGTVTRLSWLGLEKLWGYAKQLPAKLKRPPKPTIRLPEAKPVIKQAVMNTIPARKPQIKTSKRFERERQVELFPKTSTSDLPSLSLLEPATKSKGEAYSADELQAMSRELEQKLLDFGVDAKVVAVQPGPVITRFELSLAAGVKVAKLSGLAKDIARSLSITRVRVVEVIPGKPYVGLELPNKTREMVRLSEVLATEQYDSNTMALTIALGVDIAGEPAFVDLAKMPHMLVAGTTGSGKSVGLNAMLLSLLYKRSPEDLRLILIDPKMLELSVYDGIPHLLTPVVVDMKEAANSLRWCVAEMERRYKLMAALGVRNIKGFNQKVSKSKVSDPLHTGDDEPPTLSNLPFIVVVIDELADMMMVVGKQVEQLIARIAQKARAAGIHLILATQRPSVDVLTGLIKSNIPTRVAFQVSSKIDSRTILDQQGAEQLLGHGDMLYLAPGTGAPIRIHGAFVSDSEVHSIAADWKARGEPAYIEAITTTPSETPLGDTDTEDEDPLYDEAVEFVINQRKASISSVQRRFKIGYNRAARLIEEMERTGVVSPMNTNGTREVLVPKR